MSKKRRYSREEETSWGDIFRSFKEGLLGSEDDFDDDFEEVEESAPAQKEPPTQKSAPAPKPAPAQKPAPVQESAPTQQSSGGSAEAVIWRSLQADLNRFVQEGKTSEPLLQLLEEGFEKNPQLLQKLAELVESRKMEEEVHPGYLMVYQGKQTMFTSIERAFESFTQRPGSTIKETIFVSQKRNGKAVSTREATEEEKKLYYEQLSKADASGQKGQDQ